MAIFGRIKLPVKAPTDPVGYMIWVAARRAGAVELVRTGREWIPHEINDLMRYLPDAPGIYWPDAFIREVKIAAEVLGAVPEDIPVLEYVEGRVY